MLQENEKNRISKLSDLIFKASRKVKILRHIAWSEDIRNEFFDKGCSEIPKVNYPNYDPSELNLILAKTEKLMGDTRYDEWLKNKISDIKKSSDLLCSCGTKDFFKFSTDIYGLPTTPIHDKATKPIDLSEKFEEIINSIDTNQVKKMQSPKIDSTVVAERISKSVSEYFGNQAPKLKIVKELSAKATASSKTIKLRENGEFAETDVKQLINHEAYIHVATTLNGRAQKDMKILGSNYGSITKTQEGLAVFSELITGSIDVDRMRRISDRVVAIQMSIDGADFIEVYKFFLEKNGSRNQSYESARRVFRGGLLTGGAPFTKDIVYLDGLIRVYNFFRSAIAQGKTECINLIFAGKMDLDDIPVIHSMFKDGLIQSPNFVPPWAADMNFLICYFSFSVFLENIFYDNVTNYYNTLLSDVN